MIAAADRELRVGPRRGDEGRRLPLLVPGLIVGSWVLAVVAEVSGTAHFLHHDAIPHGEVRFWPGLGVFLLAWQLMTAAMMLPSSMPMIRLFWATATRQDRPEKPLAAFLGAYAGVWTVFGVAALLGDLVLHRVVDATPWLESHSWYIGGTVLLGAALFQFSELEERCLRECRHPASFLLQHYRRGTKAAFRTGLAHALFCLGCCWALMLVAFAAGVADLWWMAVMAAMMWAEKTWKHGERVATGAGLALGVLAALVLFHPGWLPAVLSGTV